MHEYVSKNDVKLYFLRLDGVEEIEIDGRSIVGTIESGEESVRNKIRSDLALFGPRVSTDGGQLKVEFEEVPYA